MQGKDGSVVVGVVALIVLLLGLSGGGMMGSGMMGWGSYGFSPWGGVFMMVFWALVIGVGIWLLARLSGQGQPAGIGPGTGVARSIDVLRERYARGDITREQFEQMRRDLEGS